MAALAAYQNVVFVFGFYGYETLGQTKGYIDKIRAELQDKKIAAVGVGLEARDQSRYQPLLQKALGKKEETFLFVHGQLDLSKLSMEDAKTLKGFTEKIGMPYKDMGCWQQSEAACAGVQLRKHFYAVEKSMPKEALKACIEDFIKKHNMVALTTGCVTLVRCSPVEYIYEGGCLYVITEGGLKFNGLVQNQQVSLGIYDAYEGMDQLGGLQITAQAEEVPCLSETYLKIMAHKKVNAEMLAKLPVTMYMIKCKPVLYELLYSPLKKQGYDAKQICDCLA